MANNEVKLRLREVTRNGILNSALQIVQAEGCAALNMRKLADEIAYTAPIIYGYFKNKEEIYTELARKGHLMLAGEMRQAKEANKMHVKQMEAMWLAYWNFAFAHQALYQLMYGVNITEFPRANPMMGVLTLTGLITEVIGSIRDQPVSEQLLKTKFYTYWALVHGLISLNFIGRCKMDKLNEQILKESIREITLSINV